MKHLCKNVRLDILETNHASPVKTVQLSNQLLIKLTNKLFIFMNIKKQRSYSTESISCIAD